MVLKPLNAAVGWAVGDARGVPVGNTDGFVVGCVIRGIEDTEPAEANCADDTKLETSKDSALKLPDVLKAAEATEGTAVVVALGGVELGTTEGLRVGIPKLDASKDRALEPNELLKTAEVIVGAVVGAVVRAMVGAVDGATDGAADGIAVGLAVS